MTLPRMRTIEEAHSYLVGMDEETAVSKYLIRELCKQQKVHCVMTGKKYLVNIDDLCQKLQENFKI